MRFVVPALVAILCAGATLAAEPVDRGAVNRILDAGMNHSEVMETAQHLTDRIGGRLTNSPQMREAERWTQSRFTDWGLKNVHKEGFEFGRGWSIQNANARMITPRVLPIRSIPIAWTPSTNGAIRAEVIVAPLKRERDFDKWRGKLKGKIVLISLPDSGSEPDKPAFRRLTDEDLRKTDSYDQASHDEASIARSIKRRSFAAKLDTFLAGEGAVAWARMARKDTGMLFGEGYLHRVGMTPRLPAVELTAEDYRRLARLAKGPDPVTLEINNEVSFNDEDVNAYNILAEIPGRDPKAGYVMAGAHLDSWVAADGAVDNGAGTAVVMEAARILSSLGFKPKRTIRFALWSGEEQGIYGSRAYVEQHLASRPQPADRDTQLYGGWADRFPITPKPGYGDLAAYFNLDNGSGKIRGIYAEGNAAAAPIFREWLAPFASLGATTVAADTTGGTDHVYLQSVGLPGYQFIQDPLDYGTRLHHTNLDTYDHMKPEDLRQAAVIMASFLLFAAERNEPLPRMPLPTKPRDTDPFAYTDDED
jgi:carboxypeptidase Q